MTICTFWAIVSFQTIKTSSIEKVVRVYPVAVMKEVIGKKKVEKMKGQLMHIAGLSDYLQHKWTQARGELNLKL